MSPFDTGLSPAEDVLEGLLANPGCTPENGIIPIGTDHARCGESTASREIRMGSVRSWGVGLCIAIATLTTATVADAQYFGRNKVQYREFKFEAVSYTHLRAHETPEH